VRADDVRRGEQKKAARLEHTIDFGDKAMGRVQMFEHFAAEDVSKLASAYGQAATARRSCRREVERFAAAGGDGEFAALRGPDVVATHRTVALEREKRGVTW